MFGDTWEWDGEYWVQVADFGPQPRLSHAMAYDENQARVALFGGATKTALLNDTWEWDGETWTQVADTGPPPRSAMAMASDTKRKRIVLHGGNRADSVSTAAYGDTWEWDGSQWAQFEGFGPHARYIHSMTYDSLRERTVLFGGFFDPGTFYGDTWEWDGSSWSEAAHFGPGPRFFHQMAFDGRFVMLFGGLVKEIGGEPYVSGETWDWNGARWTERSVVGPSPRGSHAMAFEIARGRVVLFGGFSDPFDPETPLFNDTWEASEISPGHRVASNQGFSGPERRTRR